MASAVATPLERQFGRIAGVTEMTSTSSLGSTAITLQFDLSRDIDGAARDVQAAINAARGELPAEPAEQPEYRKVNPADAPIMILALTSDTLPRGRCTTPPTRSCSRSSRRCEGVGQVIVGGGSLPAVRVELDPDRAQQVSASASRTCAARSARDQRQPAQGRSSPTAPRAWTIGANDQLFDGRASTGR